MPNNDRQDTWKVLGAIVLFLCIGFSYKYMIAPSALHTPQNTGIKMLNSSASSIPYVVEIGANPADVPPPITRKESTTVRYALEAIAVQSEIEPGTTYEYWTYNKQVPGPMLRVREGDTVEVTITHNPAGHSHGALPPINDFTISGPFSVETAHADTGHAHDAETDPHTASGGGGDTGHSAHSIDLHAVLGPGGGAMLTQTGHDEKKVFSFKAMRPGIYIYHCASAHIPTHIANGMYGMILVEPKEGLPAVDREYYMMQGEFYTTGKKGTPGHQTFSASNMNDENPQYVLFNGRVGSLSGDRALRSKTGETVRLYFGVGTFIPSNFHVIGGILERLYPEGDIVSSPHKNVQTTLVPAGGAIMTEFTTLVPGKFLLVDHALPRAIDKGAVGELIVEGAERPDIIK